MVEEVHNVVYITYQIKSVKIKPCSSSSTNIEYQTLNSNVVTIPKSYPFWDEIVFL